MRAPRFLVPYFNFSERATILPDVSLVHQIKDVLRLTKGDECIIFNGKGDEAIARILGIKGGGVEVEVQRAYKNENEAKNNVILFMSLLKKNNFEWVLQKATEIGVKTIVPLVTQRTVKMRFNEGRIKKILKEAVEQSGRAFLPEVADPITFALACEKYPCQVNVFFDPSGAQFPFSGAAAKMNAGIWIGPEGGWSPEEIEQARQHSFSIVSFGTLVFRAETAAVIGCYLASML